jgi:lipopolysaccharide transport system permease protein
MLPSDRLSPTRRRFRRQAGQVLPSAAEVARSKDILLALTRSDLLARYGRGSFTLVKWLIDPFALVGVYLALVTLVLDRPGEAPGLSLACAVVPFQLLMATMLNAMSSVPFRESIILNMRFPRMLLPISSALTESAAFAASLLLLALMMAVYGVAPTTAILWLPVAFAVNLALAISVAYGAAFFGLWYPDLRIFTISLVRTLFFLAPGLVPLSQIPDNIADWLRLNPLTGLFETYRDALLYGAAPAAWQLLYPLAFAVVFGGLFFRVYRRDQLHFARMLG